MKLNIKHLALSALFLGAAALASCNTSTEPGTTTATTASILAQDSVNYPNGCQLDSATLRTALDLTDDQVARIVIIRDSLRAAEKVEIDAANGDRHAIHEILEKYRGELQTQIAAVLTADQLAKLQALLAARGDGERNRDGKHRDMHDCRFLRADSVIIDSAMMAHMQTDLSLTNDQVVQIHALADSLNADTTVTDKAAAFLTDLKTILTAEQQATLEALIEAHDRPEGGRGRGERGHGHHGRRG